MALTRVTNQVISSNALSAEKIANNTIQGRHLADLSVQARHLATDANTSTDLSAIQANVIQLQNNLESNVNIVSANSAAVEARRVANIAGAISTVLTTDLTASRALIAGSGGKIEVSDVTSTELGHLDGVTAAIQTQLDAVEARRAANLTSATFTGEVTMNDDLIVAGNLTVTGEFANIHVTDAYSNDRIFALANGFTGTPTLDVGLQLNRGNDGNVFIGYDESSDAVAFLHNRDPFSNTLISSTAIANARSKAFQAENGSASLPGLTFYGDQDTGVYRSAADELSFTTGGTQRAKITSTGNLNLNLGVVEGPGLNSIDLDADELSDRQNSVVIRTLQSLGVFLDFNDSETGNYFNIYDAEDDPGQVGKDDGIFSVRDTGEVFMYGKVSTTGAANIALDVTSRGVNLLSNDFATYTALNANINTVSGNVDALTGGGTFFSPFSNVNTATGTSNVFFVGKSISNHNNVQAAYLDGIHQANTEYVLHFANNTLQFTDASIPSGVIVSIFSLT